MSVVRGVLPYFGDNLLLVADLDHALAAAGIEEPLVIRMSEAEKLDKILEHGTDRAGYPGDRRWRHDPTIAHAEVILATTLAENRAGEAAPEVSTSVKKLPGIAAPLCLIYAAAELDLLRPKEYRFRQPERAREALRAVFEIPKYPLPRGWFRPEEGHDYRELATRALAGRSGAEPNGIGGGCIVEVGTWLGRSTTYVAGACRFGAAKLVCVDHLAGSSDRYDAAYRERLASDDVEAELRRHLDRLGGEIELRRQASIEAAASFANQTLDMVFLDASHDHDAVAADLEAWAPKLRAGGILAGHDFAEDHPGVITAVGDFAARTGRELRRAGGTLWWLDPGNALASPLAGG